MAVLESIGTVNQSVNVDKLNGFARDFGQEIFTRMLNNTEFATHFPTETDISSERSYMKISVDADLGPYTGKVENEGDEAVYSHRKLSVNVGQSVLVVDPEKVRAAPFVKKMITDITKGGVYHEGIILAAFVESLQSKLNDFTFYKGDTASASTNKAIRMANGLEKHILACIAATDFDDKLTPVVTPAFNPGAGWQNGVTDFGNMVESFELVDDAFTPALQKKERTMFVSTSNFKKYKKNYKRVNGTDMRSDWYDNGLFEFCYLGDTAKRCKIAPATWLGTSNRIINCIDGSIRVGCDVPGMFTSIDIQKHMFLYYYLIKAIFGVQLVDVEGVRINSLS